MRILVVEDDVKHLADAKKFFATQMGVEVVYAEDLRGAVQHLKRGEVGGVISDIYLPDDSAYFPEPEACGVAVLWICRERGIPCVLNTAGYHHGSRYQWITTLVRSFEPRLLPEIVDASSDRHKEARTKNWEGALEALRGLLG